MKKKLSAAFIALVVLTTTQVHADQQEPSTTPTSIDVPSPSKLSASSIANMITYEFGATTFSNYVWVNGGNVFKGTFDYFDAEVASGWATFDIEYYNSKGEFLYADKIVEKAHWVTSSSVPAGYKDIKIRLVNRGEDPVKLKWGSVGYYP